MQIEKTPLADCYIIKPQVHHDHRGYFFESFNALKFKELTGITTDFVQDNQSFSSYGVVRALHAQRAPYAQAKLVRVLQGGIGYSRGCTTGFSHLWTAFCHPSQR